MDKLNWKNPIEVKEFLTDILVENVMLRRKLEQTESSMHYWFDRCQALEKRPFTEPEKDNDAPQEV